MNCYSFVISTYSICKYQIYATKIKVKPIWKPIVKIINEELSYWLLFPHEKPPIKLTYNIEILNSPLFIVKILKILIIAHGPYKSEPPIKHANHHIIELSLTVLCLESCKLRFDVEILVCILFFIYFFFVVNFEFIKVYRNRSVDVLRSFPNNNKRIKIFETVFPKSWLGRRIKRFLVSSCKPPAVKCVVYKADDNL